MSNGTLVYTSSEAMQALSMSKDLFWQLVHAGTIPSVKVSERKYIFSKTQINSWLDGKFKTEGGKEEAETK